MAKRVLTKDFPENYLLLERETKGSDIVTHDAGAPYSLITEDCMINNILQLFVRIEEYYKFCLDGLSSQCYTNCQGVARSNCFFADGKEKSLWNLLK